MREKEIKKICVVTATRAEYGLLYPIIERLMSEPRFDIRVAVTGAHLSPEFGLTYKEIEQDQIAIDKKIEILLSSDTPSAISKSMGLALMGFADYFSEQDFDMIVLLGDRYEALAVACSAMNAQIPIAHLYGGTTTVGVIDEGIRHAITKLSYLHMTGTEEERKRVIQMGESPERVFCVGESGIENALHTNFIAPSELFPYLEITGKRPFALVTFHPVTLEKNSSAVQTKELLRALEQFPEWDFVVTKANADRDGRIINELFLQYADSHNNVKLFDSLGMRRYLSALKYCKMVIGNSSSGLVEAPSFDIPTVNIGDRQRGRIKAESVIDCEPNKESIEKAMREAMRMSLGKIKNPYGDGETSRKVLAILQKVLFEENIDLKKPFYDISFNIKREQ